VYDANVATADVPIASLKFSYAQLRRNKAYFETPRWYPLYGAPREPEAEFSLRAGAKLARRMNNGYVDGSDYRGALFLSMHAGTEAVLNPAKRRGLPMPDVAPAVNLILIAEVLQLDLVLPEERGMGAEVAVEVSYGMSSVWTAMWYEAKSMRASGGDVFVPMGEKLKPFNALVVPPLTGDDAGTGAPDVFVNVWWSSPTVKKRRVAFGRVPLACLLPAQETDFPEEAPEASTGGVCNYQQWLPLQADALGVRKGSSTVRAARPQGSILVRLQLTRKPNNQARALRAQPRVQQRVQQRVRRRMCAACAALTRAARPQVYILGVTDVEEAAKRAEEEKKARTALNLSSKSPYLLNLTHRHNRSSRKRWRRRRAKRRRATTRRLRKRRRSASARRALGYSSLAAPSARHPTRSSSRRLPPARTGCACTCTRRTASRWRTRTAAATPSASCAAASPPRAPRSAAAPRHPPGLPRCRWRCSCRCAPGRT
jgi:hypothetical protein